MIVAKHWFRIRITAAEARTMEQATGAAEAFAAGAGSVPESLGGGALRRGYERSFLLMVLADSQPEAWARIGDAAVVAPEARLESAEYLPGGAP